MRLEDPWGVDRAPLPPRHEQGGVRRRGVCHPPGARDRGGRKTIHHLCQQLPNIFDSTHTISMDSTMAIEIRSDSIGPGQGFAVTAIEVCTRPRERDNEVTIRWVPAHQGVLGNEKADE